jgi:hypothetical protein
MSRRMETVSIITAKKKETQACFIGHLINRWRSNVGPLRWSVPLVDSPYAMRLVPSMLLWMGIPSLEAMR